MANRLGDVPDSSYTFRFSDYINDSFKLYLKHWMPFAGAIIIYVAIYAIVGGIGGFSSLNSGVTFSSIYTLMINILLAPLTAGFFIMIRNTLYDERVNITDLFSGYEYFRILLILSLLNFLCYLPFNISLIINANYSGESNPYNFFYLVIVIIKFYIGLLFTVASLFIVFFECTISNAISLSFRLINKKLLIVFLFSFALILIALAGIALFGIALLLTLPSMMIAAYLAFSDITGLDKELEGESDEIDILEHLVDM